MVVSLLAVLSHSKKLQGSNLPANWGISVQSLHGLPVSPVSFGFPPTVQFRDM